MRLNRPRATVPPSSTTTIPSRCNTRPNSRQVAESAIHGPGYVATIESTVASGIGRHPAQPSNTFAPRRTADDRIAREGSKPMTLRASRTAITESLPSPAPTSIRYPVSGVHSRTYLRLPAQAGPKTIRPVASWKTKSGPYSNLNRCWRMTILTGLS